MSAEPRATRTAVVVTRCRLLLGGGPRSGLLTLDHILGPVDDGLAGQNLSEHDGNGSGVLKLNASMLAMHFPREETA
jgi:hypothetical protein